MKNLVLVCLVFALCACSKKSNFQDALNQANERNQYQVAHHLCSRYVVVRGKDGTYGVAEDDAPCKKLNITQMSDEALYGKAQTQIPKEATKQ